MKHLQFFLALGMAGAYCGSANAAEIKVIANPSIKATTLPAEDLKRIFLATKTSLADGSRVEPVLEKSGAVHEAFLKEYVGKSDSGLATYYRSLVFTGKGSMPKAFASDAQVVDYVAKTAGAVGYVAAGATAAGVKTIEVK